MRSQPKGIVLFLLQVDPIRDKIDVEDVAALEEGMISLQRFDRAAE